MIVQWSTFKDSKQLNLRGDIVRKLFIAFPRYWPLVKIMLLVAIAVAAAVAGGAPDIFDP